MRKKIITIFTLALVLCISVVCLVACNKALCFDKDEYLVSDGTTVNINGKATYSLVGEVPDGVSVSEKGVFSITSNASNGAQVLLAAKIKGKVVDVAVCTVSITLEKPVLEIINFSNYLVSGDQVEAVATPAYSITYSLKQDYQGIKVHPVTGKVSYTEAVAEGAQFVVVAESHGEKVEKQFLATVGNYVTAEQNSVITEYGVGLDVSFTVDFGVNAEAEEQGVLSVARGRNKLQKDVDFSYDAATKTVTILPAYASTMGMGINNMRIVTAKNAVAVQVKVAKYITSAQELAAINDSVENLRGYYVLVRDLDLSDYLSGEGYDNGNYWKPIGIYHDVADGTATDWAFAGEFDGNGHVITGLKIKRSAPDPAAFNAGLFGYIASGGVVHNLGVVGEVDLRSFSGGFVGVNTGKVYDCWANVKVVADGCRILGSFVGRNEGTMYNCYSLGSVSGEEEVGSFCGVNQGVIKNCYCVSVGGYNFISTGEAENSAAVATSAALAGCDFSAWTDWIVLPGNIPTLPTIELSYLLKSVEISNKKQFVTKGDEFDIVAVTNPTKYATEVGLTYEIIDGDGVTVDENGHVDTRSAQSNTCTIRISCGTVYTDYTFGIYSKITTKQFTSDTESTMYADGYYRIAVDILPATANQQVTFGIQSTIAGVKLEGDVVSVSPNVVSGTITLVATFYDGSSITKTVQIVGDNLLPQGEILLFRDDLQDVKLTLPHEAADKVTAVKRFNKAVPYTMDGDDVVIEGCYFTSFGNDTIPVLVETTVGKYRTSVVVYEDSANIVFISSVEQFNQFFDDVNNYDRTVILTADLDFANAERTSIGWYSESDAFCAFSGIFNGNGHTISNLKIIRSGLPITDVNDEFDSAYYTVGLFGYLTGTVSNLNMENVTVCPTFKSTEGEEKVVGNFTGLVAGFLSGTVRNCSFVGCTATSKGGAGNVVYGNALGGIVDNCTNDGELVKR